MVFGKETDISFRADKKEQTMLKIGIVDDDPKATDNLVALLKRYETEEKTEMSIVTYASGRAFLNEASSSHLFDLLFLDIQILDFSGLELAKLVRQYDKEVRIIFETDFGQYAIYGYKYDATDYFLKPVGYYDLKLRLKNIIKSFTKKIPDDVLVLHIDKGIRNVSVAHILYVEEKGHCPAYHLDSGDVLISSKRKSLSVLDKEYDAYDFCRASSGFLVNLHHCTTLNKDTVQVGPDTLYLSRRMKKIFIDKLSAIYSDSTRKD
jgi:DNA-binding LytR/AlgR family response regulator